MNSSLIGGSMSTSTLKKEFDKAVEARKNQEVVFERAPKKALRKAVKTIMEKHRQTIEELAHR